MGRAKSPKAYQPTFPIFLIGSERAPIILSHSSKRFALGFSTRELPKFVATQLAAQEQTSIGILAYRDQTSFVDTVTRLVALGVNRMSWDLMDSEQSGYFVDLDRLVRGSVEG